MGKTLLNTPCNPTFARSFASTAGCKNVSKDCRCNSINGGIWITGRILAKLLRARLNAVVAMETPSSCEFLCSEQSEEAPFISGRSFDSIAQITTLFRVIILFRLFHQLLRAF